MPAITAGDVEGHARVRATLLGPFALHRGELSAGPWVRPSARRLCELVLISQGRHIGRETACEVLFPHLGASTATNALRKALSLAKLAVSALGEDAGGLLRGNAGRIWVDASIDLDIDFEGHQDALRSGLSMPPGDRRDERLVLALLEEGTLLEDEQYADWAIRPRESLDALRQQARLVLARDRARGMGRSGHADLVAAWEACFAADPSSEEAATALVRAYSAQRMHALASATYRRCQEALEELGLRVSPALEEALGAGTPVPRQPEARDRPSWNEERRLVSMLFAELSGPVAAGAKLGPEDLREVVGGALAEVVAQVEALGGTITAVSGAGVVAIFGAPESHEDDPERSLLAGLRSISATRARGGGLSLRVGVETGEAIVGPIGGGAGGHYGAVGEVVGVAAALQSVAKPASVLVGPATRSATEGLFDWGATELVALPGGTKPFLASHLDRPRARPQGQAGRRRLAGSVPLFGRGPELALLHEALRELTSGKGGVVVLLGDAGLGKTRLVHECRKLFMAWVGAASGRLPLWLEGRAASYASTRPYALYQQLLSTWVGARADESEEVSRAALGRAMRASFGRNVDDDQVELLAQVMGLGPGTGVHSISRLGPEPLRQAMFSSVRDLVARLAAHGPTLLVLEDLHWADPTSLRLTEDLASLTGENALLLVLTRRPEPDPGTSALDVALSAVPGLKVRKLELAPLGDGPENDLARVLLGEGAPDAIVKSVSDGADGNPLFLEERVTSLFETNALVRGEAGRWRLDLGTPGQVPQALERLVRARVDRLGPAQREAIVAASVLGPEFALSTVESVTDLEDDLVAAVSGLCSAGLLVELWKTPQPTYRFRHALIQEAIYKSLVRQQFRRLHARAAWGLEENSTGRVEDVASVLGHHFAIAGETERAVHYLQIAGDHAASVFANEEAVSSYRQALGVLTTSGDGFAVEAVGLWLKLGGLFWRLGRYSEGRAALWEAVGLAPPECPLLAARSYRWLGQLEIEDCRDEDALAALGAAEEVLQGCPDKEVDGWVDAWLEVQLCRSNLHYWRAETALQAEVLARVGPVIDAHASLLQKAEFFIHVAGQRWRAGRYMVDETTIDLVRTARAMVKEAGQNDEDFHWQTLGFLLLLHGELDEAWAELQGALAAARRAGDKSLELVCLVFLAWARLRQHDVAGVKEIALQSADLVSAHAFPSSGMARAMLSWVAWKEERITDAERLAEEALEEWRPSAVRYPFYWICLFPLIGARLAAARAEEAVAAARELLRPPQMRLPAELEEIIEQATSAWDGGRHDLASEALARALELAEQLDFA